MSYRITTATQPNMNHITTENINKNIETLTKLKIQVSDNDNNKVYQYVTWVTERTSAPVVMRDMY